MLLSRRSVLTGMGVGSAALAATLGYGVAAEPMRTPAIRRYAPELPAWPADLALRIAVLADIHACEPWMSAERLHGIALQTMALGADVVVVLGDFNAGHRFVSGPVMPSAWAEALRPLSAPCGVYAILGNHDWWHGPVPGMAGGPAEIRKGLAEAGITLLENSAVPVGKDGRVIWIAGLADQMAHHIRRGWTKGADDLAGTLAAVPESDPVILLAHEPYVAPRVPERVALTLCGHTHGGQVNLPLIGAPLSPTRRYRYGHVVQGDRHCIVSGGLGESGLPIRIGVPPEILLVELGPARAAT